MNYHHVEQYLLNPMHPISITLVGVGGTGSHLLSNLAKMHISLRKMGHPGFFVTAYDDDVISSANIGRQAFSPVEVGEFKSANLVTKINRFFGLNWDSKTEKFDRTKNPGNIIISAVDTLSARKEIQAVKNRENLDFQKLFYWLDCGNSQKTGQVILGTKIKINQRDHAGIPVLPDFFEKFRDHKIKEEDQGPSCSIAEALSKQDLFINPIIAGMAGNLLWKMFRETKLFCNGIFVNLETMRTNPIPIEKKAEKKIAETKPKRTLKKYD